MSYILDALKRADAERERGAVPGLHTQQATTLMPPVDPNPQRRLWPLLAVSLALGCVVVGLWVWQTSGRDTRAAPVEIAAVRPTAPPPVASQDVESAPMPKPVPPSAPAVAAQALSKPQVRPVVAAAESNAVAPTAAISAAHTVAPAASVAAVVPLLNELPEDIRRQIPTLTVTGAVDSDYPAQRMLLVNGQVLKQGSMLTPDLNLEEIRAHSSVLSFRGTKFRIAY
jgi:general secretion pathway protein B